MTTDARLGVDHRIDELRQVAAELRGGRPSRRPTPSAGPAGLHLVAGRVLVRLAGAILDDPRLTPAMIR